MNKQCRETTCFAAVSSSFPSPMTTYVHLRLNLALMRSKQLSLPDRQTQSTVSQAKRLAEKNESEMTYFVSGGT